MFASSRIHTVHNEELEKVLRRQPLGVSYRVLSLICLQYLSIQPCPGIPEATEVVGVQGGIDLS
jgi:hypothetical protein